VNYYGGCGGSVFKTAFWATLNPKEVTGQLKEFAKRNNNEFHSDMVLGFLCILNGGNMCCGQTLFPTELAERPANMGDKTYPAILHMYKDLYNVEPTEMDQYILVSDDDAPLSADDSLLDDDAN
jgi:hypothetical protein